MALCDNCFVAEHALVRGTTLTQHAIDHDPSCLHQLFQLVDAFDECNQISRKIEFYLEIRINSTNQKTNLDERSQNVVES